MPRRDADNRGEQLPRASTGPRTTTMARRSHCGAKPPARLPSRPRGAVRCPGPRTLMDAHDDCPIAEGAAGPAIRAPTSAGRDGAVVGHPPLGSTPPDTNDADVGNLLVDEIGATDARRELILEQLHAPYDPAARPGRSVRHPGEQFVGDGGAIRRRRRVAVRLRQSVRKTRQVTPNGGGCPEGVRGARPCRRSPEANRRRSDPRAGWTWRVHRATFCPSSVVF